MTNDKMEKISKWTAEIYDNEKVSQTDKLKMTLILTESFVRLEPFYDKYHQPKKKTPNKATVNLISNELSRSVMRGLRKLSDL